MKIDSANKQITLTGSEAIAFSKFCSHIMDWLSQDAGECSFEEAEDFIDGLNLRTHCIAEDEDTAFEYDVDIGDGYWRANDAYKALRIVFKSGK